MRVDYFSECAEKDWQAGPCPIPGYTEGEETITIVQAKDIRQYATPFFFRSMEIFANFKIFNTLPHGKGTSKERNTVIQIIKILTTCQNEFDEWEREKSMAEVRSN